MNTKRSTATDTAEPGLKTADVTDVRTLTEAEVATIAGALWNPFESLGRYIGGKAYDAAHYYCAHPK